MGMNISSPGFQRAIDIRGNQTNLGEALGVAQSTISNWLKNGVPAEWCAAIEHVTGVPREEIRPDVFGPVPSLKPQRKRGRISFRERVAS